MRHVSKGALLNGLDLLLTGTVTPGDIHEALLEAYGTERSGRLRDWIVDDFLYAYSDTGFELSDYPSLKEISWIATCRTIASREDPEVRSRLNLSRSITPPIDFGRFDFAQTIKEHYPGIEVMASPSDRLRLLLSLTSRAAWIDHPSWLRCLEAVFNDWPPQSEEERFTHQCFKSIGTCDEFAKCSLVATLLERLTAALLATST